MDFALCLGFMLIKQVYVLSLIGEIEVNLLIDYRFVGEIVFSYSLLICRRGWGIHIYEGCTLPHAPVVLAPSPWCPTSPVDHVKTGRPCKKIQVSTGRTGQGWGTSWTATNTVTMYRRPRAMQPLSLALIKCIERLIESVLRSIIGFEAF